MTNLDAPSVEESSPKQYEASRAEETLESGFNVALKINHHARSLILDYALAAALLGLLPLHPNNWLGALDISILGLLNLKMIRDIRVCWGHPRGQDAFTVVSSLLGVFGAFAIAIFARLIISTLGLFIPVIVIFDGAVGHATLTWALGCMANQFYLSTQNIDSSTLRPLLQRYLKR